MRKIKYYLIAMMIFVSMALFVIFVSFDRGYVHTTTDYALNTIVKVTVEAKSEKDAIKAGKDAVDEIKRIENLLSCHIPGSDIYRINDMGYSQPQRVEDETYEILSRCIGYSHLTGGAFDITVKPLCDLWDVTSDNPKVPDRQKIEKLLKSVGIHNIELRENNMVSLLTPDTKIDLGGVAKGYCADRVKSILKEQGIENALIDLGGNIYAMGSNQKDKPWSIGIQKPFALRGEHYYKLEISDLSLVTSGAYERYFEYDGNIYHHIIDAKNGYPAESDIKSVTVVADSSELADVLSTSIFVLGSEKGQELLKVQSNMYAIMLKYDDSIIDTRQNKSK